MSKFSLECHFDDGTEIWASFHWADSAKDFFKQMKRNPHCRALILHNNQRDIITMEWQRP